MNGLLDALQYIFVTLLIIAAAYVASRWLAIRSREMTQGKYLKMVDRIVLGKDKAVVVLQMGQKFFLMTESAQGFSNMTELCQEDLIPLEPIRGTSFKEVLGKYTGIHIGETETPFNSMADLKSRASNSLKGLKQKHREKDQKDGE